ncbi:DNA alkylation repair protein [Rossellomorea marisflavi]|uniref:DNA alkylation repair protein n=1 Tax=Rossellomorea marisflavi TaxID=189381 RepID=UPI002079E41C|nr:DNA alkylation repair protein [Rossellomorea marisflavi]USK92004.1 DNA alkylation repair protein [Rossellomorea marisflavi]
MRELMTNCEACGCEIYCENGFYQGDEELRVCLACSSHVRTYTATLLRCFKEMESEENRVPMEAYMRNQFSFYGIKTPERNAALKDFVKQYGDPPLQELPSVTKLLWDEPGRECQYAALYLLSRQVKKLTLDHLPLLEELIVKKSWWDTIDGIAPNLAGSIFLKHGDGGYPERWITSDHIWLNRSAILYQLKYKDKTEEDRLFGYIRKKQDSKEFFIQKAIGWALREYSKTNPTAVEDFIENEDLAPLSEREGMKHINKIRG